MIDKNSNLYHDRLDKYNDHYKNLIIQHHPILVFGRIVNSHSGEAAAAAEGRDERGWGKNKSVRWWGRT